MDRRSDEDGISAQIAKTRTPDDQVEASRFAVMFRLLEFVVSTSHRRQPLVAPDESAATTRRPAAPRFGYLTMGPQPPASRLGLGQVDNEREHLAEPSGVAPTPDSKREMVVQVSTIELRHDHRERRNVPRLRRPSHAAVP